MSVYCETHGQCVAARSEVLDIGGKNYITVLMGDKLATAGRQSNFKLASKVSSG